jgi:acylphosphatase
VLLDRGYQKFLKTGKVEVVATAADLENLHRFSEELKEATGYTSLYNEGLGSVSGSYQYDRVTNRDLPEDKRPPRPWQK